MRKVSNSGFSKISLPAILKLHRRIAVLTLWKTYQVDLWYLSYNCRQKLEGSCIWSVSCWNGIYIKTLQNLLWTYHPCWFSFQKNNRMTFTLLFDLLPVYSESFVRKNNILPTAFKWNTIAKRLEPRHGSVAGVRSANGSLQNFETMYSIW